MEEARGMENQRSGDDGSNGWKRHEMLVLRELDRLSDSVDGLSSICATLQKEVAVLSTTIQIKSGVWGAVSGAVLIISYIMMSKLN